MLLYLLSVYLINSWFSLKIVFQKNYFSVSQKKNSEFQIKLNPEIKVMWNTEKTSEFQIKLIPEMLCDTQKTFQAQHT